MITRNNLLTEYPNIDQSILPKALQQEEFAFISENIDLVDDDEDIRKFVDTFIEKLNEVLDKLQTKVVPGQENKPVKQQPDMIVERYVAGHGIYHRLELSNLKINESRNT